MSTKSDRPTLETLELSIVQLYSSGYQYKEIAQELQRSEANIKWHAMRVRDKLGARTMAHAVYIASKKGLI
jgi:DNA-binding NarL/FixJ family response regulator